MRFSLIERVNQRMRLVRRSGDGEVRLEQPVPKHAQLVEHRPAQHNVIFQRSAFDVLDDVRSTSLNEHLAHRSDQIGPLVGVAVALRQVGIGLARRGGVNHVERREKVDVEHHRVRLNERERVIRLGIDIDADDVESGLMIPEGGSAGATEEVEQLWSNRHRMSLPTPIFIYRAWLDGTLIFAFCPPRLIKNLRVEIRALTPPSSRIPKRQAHPNPAA